MMSALRSAVVPSGPASSAITDEETTSYEDLLERYQYVRDQYDICARALATAAHDLRTPLAIISGYLELLLSEKMGTLNQQQREIAESMRLNGTRLSDLIADFLSFSSLQSGRVVMRLEEGDLNECLRELCGLWLPRFEQRQVAFYHLLSESLRPFAFDHLRVQRVVANLLENAVKFTPPGGTVWLISEPDLWDRRRTMATALKSERRLGKSSLPNGIRVTVSDTGPGIAPQFQQEIFDDFFRLTNGEGGHEGMGLGLAICRRLICAHGGNIWVESQVGSGSKFSFFLPFEGDIVNNLREAI